MVLSATQDVFELVLARAVLVEGGEDAGLVHLWWRAPGQGERLVQVYVDGGLYDVSMVLEQREMWLVLDHGRGRRIELLAVDAGDGDGVWRERPGLLGGWSPAVAGEVSVGLIRDVRLPVDARVEVSVDGAVVDRGRVWGAGDHRGGFGAVFGVGEFGRDAATGVGLGGGELGAGPLGEDGTGLRWRRDDLDEGERLVELSAVDGGGEVVAGGLSLGVLTVEGLVEPAGGLMVDGDFTLRWTL